MLFVRISGSLVWRRTMHQSMYRYVGRVLFLFRRAAFVFARAVEIMQIKMPLF